MTINSNHLLVDKKAFPRNTFIGYVLEIDKKSQKIKNIVFISNKSHNIYTIDDKNENIKNFSIELDNYIPMLGDFDQSFFEKTSRILKL
ncbi:TPA: hypothetical protein DEP21_04830 [Patescibacteria group bacterium]|nr:hypothetical protein [Candidatus Gracilibacteria bacterium]